jgi:hypothetical protein
MSDTSNDTASAATAPGFGLDASHSSSCLNSLSVAMLLRAQREVQIPIPAAATTASVSTHQDALPSTDSSTKLAISDQDLVYDNSDEKQYDRPIQDDDDNSNNSLAPHQDLVLGSISRCPPYCCKKEPVNECKACCRQPNWCSWLVSNYHSSIHNLDHDVIAARLNENSTTVHIRQIAVLAVIQVVLVTWVVFTSGILVPGAEDSTDKDMYNTRLFFEKTLRYTLIFMTSVAVLVHSQLVAFVLICVTTFESISLRYWLYDALFGELETVHWGQNSVGPYATADEFARATFSWEFQLVIGVTAFVLLCAVFVDHRLESVQAFARYMARQSGAIAAVLFFSGSFQLVKELIDNSSFGHEQWFVCIHIVFMGLLAATPQKYDFGAILAYPACAFVQWATPRGQDRSLGARVRRWLATKLSASEDQDDPTNKTTGRPWTVSEVISPLYVPLLYAFLIAQFYTVFTIIEPLSILSIGLGMLKAPWKFVRLWGVHVFVFGVAATQMTMREALTPHAGHLHGAIRGLSFVCTEDSGVDCVHFFQYCATAQPSGAIINNRLCGNGICVSADGSSVIANQCYNGLRSVQYFKAADPWFRFDHNSPYDNVDTQEFTMDMFGIQWIIAACFFIFRLFTWMACRCRHSKSAHTSESKSLEAVALRTFTLNKMH